MKKLFFHNPLLFAIAIFINLVTFNTILFAKGKSGSLTGTVRFLGKMPPRESSPVKINPEVCGSIFLEESLVNFDNKGVKNAVISLKKKTDGLDPSSSEKKIFLTSKKCHLEPYVTGEENNLTLNIINSDPILHVMKFSKKDQVLFTLPLPPNGTIVKKIDQTGIIHVTCVLHPFMESFIMVFDTPLYSFSDQNGKFHFPEIEPGKYILSIWHKSFGPIEEEIEIIPGKTLTRFYELKQD